MSPWTYGWLCGRHWMTRQRALLLGLSCCIGIAIMVASIAASAARGYLLDLGDDSASAIVEVSSVTVSGDARPLTTETVRAAEAADDIESVMPWGQVGFSIPAAEGAHRSVSGIAFWATPYYPQIAGDAWKGADAGLGDGEVVMPSSVSGTDLSELIGNDVSVEATRRTGPNEGESVQRTWEVTGVHDGESLFDQGNNVAYVSTGTFEDLVALQETGADDALDTQWDVIYLQAQSVEDSIAVAERLQDQGYAAESLAQRLQSLPALIDALRIVGWLLLAGVGLLLTVTMGAVASSWSASRREEVGMLRATGWSTAELRSALFVQLGLIGALLGGLGVIIGLGGAGIVGAVGADRVPGLGAADATIPVWWPVLATPAVAGVLAVLGAWRGVATLMNAPSAELLKGL